MSLPKEPRQKMINMMYLVLTALLALNVSVEVLNAFKTVNHSIEKSNAVVTEKNDMTYKSFEQKLNDPQTMALAKIWAPKAMEVKKLSSDLTTYIESLKEKVINESSPKTVNGKREFADGNLDAATRIFDTQKEGKALYERLKKFRLDLLDIVDPSHYPDQPSTIQADLKAAKEEFTHRLPLDTRIPQSESGNALTGDSAKDWTIRYFHMTPTIAALTILSKFQSDVKGSESQVIDYLHKKIGEVKVVYDKFQVLAQASSNYVMPNDPITVTAGVGAFSAAAKPEITINGQKYEVGTDGTASFTTKAEGPGEHTVNVHIVYTKPDGSPGIVDKPVKFTVGLPSGSSVFLKKMNVLYIAEDNPVVISGGSVGREKVHVSFDKGEISNVSGDEYNIVPKTPGEGKITVNAAGKITTFDMRVKYLPDPTGYIGSKKGGAISSAEFKAIGGMIAKLEGSEFQSQFRIVGFKLAALGGNVPQYKEAVNEGNRWNGAAASIVSQASPGTNIFFDDIRCVGKDGRTRVLPPMVFSLK